MKMLVKKKKRLLALIRIFPFFAIKRNIDDTGINESAKSYAW